MTSPKSAFEAYWQSIVLIPVPRFGRHIGFALARWRMSRAQRTDDELKVMFMV